MSDPKTRLSRNAWNEDRDSKPVSYFPNWTVRLSRATFRLAAGVAKLCLEFAVAGADTFTKPESDQRSLEFGALNYRTGKFDNGLDPLGWYDLN